MTPQARTRREHSCGNPCLPCVPPTCQLAQISPAGGRATHYSRLFWGPHTLYRPAQMLRAPCSPGPVHCQAGLDPPSSAYVPYRTGPARGQMIPTEGTRSFVHRRSAYRRRELGEMVEGASFDSVPFAIPCVRISCVAHFSPLPRRYHIPGDTTSFQVLPSNHPLLQCTSHPRKVASSDDPA